MLFKQNVSTSCNQLKCETGKLYIVANKTKGQISKWVFQENKARQIF